MKTIGTDPDTGYLAYAYEAGDIEVGMRVETKDGQRLPVKRTGINHILCSSWPEDVIVKYENIKKVIGL